MQKRCAEFVNITRAESSVLAQNCGIPSVSASINAVDGSRGSMCSDCPSICTCVGRGIPTDLPSASGLCRVIFATQKLGTFVYSWAEMTDEVTWWMRPVTAHSSTSEFTTLLHLFNDLFSRTTWVSQYRKGKTVWIYMRQEMMRFLVAVASAGPFVNSLHLAADR